MIISIVFIFLCSCKNENGNPVIAVGQMPNLVKDNSDNIHLVYGNGDSILYSYSSNRGSTFSAPSLISILPKLAASHTRGPQIASTSKGLIVTACNEMGDIFSFAKDGSGKWSQGARVNDMDTVAKENLMALAADGDNAFAVWLDLRDKHNKIFGAKSTDGGKSWSKNIMIYASPDTTVCECCKPSVAVKENNVYVMFRNWLNGNRDMYFTQSADTGNTFNAAKKLGAGSWALNGCPMDGGGISIDNAGNLATVWQRESKVFTCEPGKPEMELGVGRSCSIETVGKNKVYTWIEKDKVICVLPDGKKEFLGDGQQPVIKAINDKQFICVWENENEIHRSIVEIL